MRLINYLVIAFLLVFALISCEKIRKLPDTPHVEFRSFSVYDTVDILENKIKAGTLNFYFEDGDGDLGLNAPEDSLADSINLFLTLYREVNGRIIPAPAGDPFKPTGFRIPYMDNSGQNKILKGIISVNFTYLFYSSSDSLKYDFYVRDRALNVSNTDSTGIIPISKNGVYKR
jgi:hypothetical protein